jgi:hypothetical protein
MKNEIIREMGEGNRESHLDEEILREIERKMKLKKDFYADRNN